VELLSDIVGVRVSLGALSAVEERVSCAVQPCVDEAWDRVRAADVKHTDGTSWYCCRARWLMFNHADRLMGIIVGGRVRTRLDADGHDKSQRPGRGAAEVLALSEQRFRSRAPSLDSGYVRL
jgi:hypothetical protein